MAIEFRNGINIVGFTRPTPTPTPTPSVTPTVTPTITITSTNTPTPTPTNTVTPTDAPATPTPTSSVTPTITNTPTPSVTQTVTITPTNTPTPSVTQTITITPSITSTITNTPTPSVTPTTPNNLILYYDPSNPASYPGTGTTITDLSGNGRNGTMSNISFTSPYFTYNGSSSQISVADNPLLEAGTGNWTMEVWVNQSVAGNDVVLGKFDPGGTSQDVSYSIRTTSTSYYAQLGSGSGSGSTLYVNSTTHTGTLNTWYHIVYVFTNVAANTLETFVNGSSIGSVSHSLPSLLNTTANLYIGSYNGGEYAQWFDGKIGITRLYNKALTASEVLNNYNNDISKYIPATPTPTPTPTNTITPTITPTSGTVSDIIASSLTTSLTNYNNAAVGDFVKVTLSEYSAVVTATSASKYVMNDTDLTGTTTNWSTNYNVSYNDTTNAIGSIPTNNYIIGFAYGVSHNTATTVTTYLRGGTTANGTHTKIGSNITYTAITGVQQYYFIRKSPTTPTSNKTYISNYISNNGTRTIPSGKTNYPIYYSQNIDTNTWSLFTGAYPTLQVIATPNKQW